MKLERIRSGYYKGSLNGIKFEIEKSVSRYNSDREIVWIATFADSNLETIYDDALKYVKQRIIETLK